MSSYDVSLRMVKKGAPIRQYGLRVFYRRQALRPKPHQPVRSFDVYPNVSLGRGKDSNFSLVGSKRNMVCVPFVSSQSVNHTLSFSSTKTPDVLGYLPDYRHSFHELLEGKYAAKFFSAHSLTQILL